MTTAVQLAQSASPGTSLGFKNRIINGDMRIDQRNAGASVTTTAAYTLDRWIFEESSDAVCTVQQVSDAPAGFTSSLKVTATTADATIGATQYSVITQWIEGYNIADLGFGAAGASSVTVSLWVKASQTGIYSCTLVNNGATRINPSSFTVNAANTWEYKTITFTGDTTGTWLTTNGRGMSINIYTVLGSNYLGSPGWNSSSVYGVTGQANAYATVNNTFQVTGVQLEKGTAATPFEYRDYGRELLMCQRYYWKYTGSVCTIANWDGYTHLGTVFLKQTMRASPTLSYSNLSDFAVLQGGTSYAPNQGLSITIDGTSTIEFDAATASPQTTGGCAFIRTTGWLAFSSEL